MTPRVPADSLIGFATSSLQRMGMEPAKADAVADVLVEGDLLGHTTHGLQLLPLYLSEIEKKQMTIAGQPVVLADRPAAVTWDGRRLPGPVAHARGDRPGVRVAPALFGTCAVVIRRSHHIGALAAYLEARHRSGADDPAHVLGRVGRGGRAARRLSWRLHAESSRGGLADRRRSGDARRLSVDHHQPHDAPAARGRPEVPGAVGRRQSGHPDRRSWRPVHGLRRVRCCRRAAPITATRATRWVCSSKR